MSSVWTSMESNDGDTTPPARLPFPPLTRQHILHCSYHHWHPLYRSLTPKARLVPLSDAFIEYLRSDGILLPPEDAPLHHDSDDDSGIFSAEDEAGYDSDEEEDPSASWRDIHASIKQTIAELGGKVVPKLNWSAPKDATWINATNSMDCRTPNDVYLLLKSSDFITHDLDHVFDDCVEDTKDDGQAAEAMKLPYHLVLRKHILINPAVEFRCFVRKRKLLGVCQRDLNHFDFLQNMRGSLLARIQKFFDDKLKDTFPDESFAFDVYIPPPHDRVWLVDINPWALRTDPILFSWLELLTMPDFSDESFQKIPGFVRLSINGANQSADASSADLEDSGSEDASDVEEVDEVLPAQPEFRLIKRDDPEAFSFSTQQYSAHKLPKDVVDASQGGPGPMRELADNWKEMLARQRQQQDEEDSSEG